MSVLGEYQVLDDLDIKPIDWVGLGIKDREFWDAENGAGSQGVVEERFMHVMMKHRVGWQKKKSQTDDPPLWPLPGEAWVILIRKMLVC